MHCAWSEIHAPDWYINLYIYELALARTVESDSLGTRDEANDVWSSINGFFQDTNKNADEVLANDSDKVEKALYESRCRKWYRREVANPPVIDVPACPLLRRAYSCLSAPSLAN